MIRGQTSENNITVRALIRAPGIISQLTRDPTSFARKDRGIEPADIPIFAMGGYVNVLADSHTIGGRAYGIQNATPSYMGAQLIYIIMTSLR